MLNWNNTDGFTSALTRCDTFWREKRTSWKLGIFFLITVTASGHRYSRRVKDAVPWLTTGCAATCTSNVCASEQMDPSPHSKRSVSNQWEFLAASRCWSMRLTAAPGIPIRRVIFVLRVCCCSVVLVYRWMTLTPCSVTSWGRWTSSHRYAWRKKLPLHLRKNDPNSGSGALSRSWRFYRRSMTALLYSCFELTFCLLFVAIFTKKVSYIWSIFVSLWLTNSYSLVT